MIALTRPLCVFDTETTGSSAETDRIVEIGFVMLKPAGEAPVEWWSLINPTIPIPHEASHGNGTTYEGHGITDAHVRGCRVCYRHDQSVVAAGDHLDLERGHAFETWPTFKEIAAKLAVGFTGVDFGGYNIDRFDLPLLKREMTRAGQTEWSYEEARVVDGQRLWQLIDPRTLSDACERFLKRKHVGAHRTTADVRTSVEVISAQADLLGTGDVEVLHERSWPQEPDWIDKKGKLVWKDGEAVVNFGKRWKGTPLKMMTRKDLYWIADEATGISDQVRRICKEAAGGRFPARTL